MPTNDSMRFQIGDVVIERLAAGIDAETDTSMIDDVHGDVCRTATGRFYDRLTGRGVPAGGGYRAIHSFRIDALTIETPAT